MQLCIINRFKAVSNDLKEAAKVIMFVIDSFCFLR